MDNEYQRAATPGKAGAVGAVSSKRESSAEARRRRAAKVQELDPITRHHFENIAIGKTVRNKDKSVSTVKTLIYGDENGEHLIPTVWDGRVLSAEEAIKRAKVSGIKWPSAKTPQELEAYDKELHRYMRAKTTPDEAAAILRGDDLDWRVRMDSSEN